MTAKIKLNATSGGGSVSLQAPTSTTSDGNIVFKLPVADGSANQVIKTDASGNLGWLTAGTATTNGITVADQWRISSGFTGNAEPVTNNWERSDNGWAALGGGISAPSSGIWTFPSTGYYLINWHADFAWTSSTPFIGINIKYTSNNSSYVSVSEANTYLNNVSDTTYVSTSCEVMLKITDTSNQKIKVEVHRYAGSETFSVLGDTNNQRTGLTFVRMGDI